MVLSNGFFYERIQLDTINERFNKVPTAKEGDANGRGMIVVLTENGLVKNTTGVSLLFKWEHTRIAEAQGLEDFEPLDLTKGEYIVTYPTEMNHEGYVKAEIRIIDNGKYAGSRNMKIQVEPSVGDDTAMESSNQFSALVTALLEVNSWNARIDAVEADFIQRANDVEATYPQELVSLTSQLAEKAERYVDRLVLSKILNHVPEVDTTNIMQGFCVVGDRLVFVLKNESDTTATVYKYNLITNVLGVGVHHTNLKHANDLCFVPETNLIYVATDGSASVVALNADTLQYDSTVSFPVNVGAIGYDKTNSLFAVRDYTNKNFHILSPSLSVLKTFNQETPQTEQGLCFDKGVIYMTYFEVGTSGSRQTSFNPNAINTSTIVAYDTSGNILKTWKTGKIGEIESLDIHDNRFIVGANDTQMNKVFYNTAFKSNVYEPQETTVFEVENLNMYKCNSDTSTIYCDSKAIGIGNGTSATPFSSLRDAFTFMYNTKSSYNFILNLSGDFTSEGNILISGITKPLEIICNNAKIHSISIFNCRVKMTRIDFLNVDTSASLYVDNSYVDIRSCTFNNSNLIPGRKGIHAQYSTLIFQTGLASTFNGYEYAVFSHASTILLHQAQTYTNNGTNMRLEHSICKCKPNLKSGISFTNTDFLDGYVQVFGSVSMQCSVAGTTVTQNITIPNATKILFSSVNVNSGSPQSIHCTVSVIAGNEITIAFNRSDTNATGVSWMCIVEY